MTDSTKLTVTTQQTSARTVRLTVRFFHGSLGLALLLGGCTADSNPGMTSFGDGADVVDSGGEGGASTDASDSGSTSDGGQGTGDATGLPNDDADSGTAADDDGDDDDTGSTTTGPDGCACEPTEFCDRGVCTPIGPPLQGEVIFTELHPDSAAVSNFDGEWIELSNVADKPVDLVGCVLADEGRNDDAYTIALDPSSVLPPGGRIVMSKFTGSEVNGGLPPIAYGFEQAFSLTNTGDVAVLQCNGMLVDRVAYDQGWPFAAGVAMQLSPDAMTGMDNDLAANWCEATTTYGLGDLGTPEADNHDCP